MNFPRAFSALTGASALSMAAQVVRGKLAALILGPAGVGVFNQLSLAWNVANVAGSLGTFSGLVQHGAEAIASGEKEALRRLSSTFTLLLGAVSLGIAILGAVFARPLSGWLLHDGGAHAPLVALLMLGVPVGVTAQTYRALLSAGRAVGPLVRTQIASDLGGALIFAVLLYALGLKGAVIGFMASHLILFLVQAVHIRRQFGAGHLLPNPARFSWALVRTNIGFGASGLLLIVLNNLAILLVSRLIIDRLGPEANGFFANGWRIASVYLGAVTATAIGYYLPTLARTTSDGEMGKEVNATLRFYLGILPPVMAGIMAGGSLIVWLILSKAFLPVAGLLLLFVPAELLRMLTDTVLAQFLARRRLKLFTLTYVVQFLAFLSLAYLFLPSFGVAGAAMAYGAAMATGLVLALIAARLRFGFVLEGATLKLSLLAVLLLGGAGLICWTFEEGLLRYAIAIAATGLWFVLALRDGDFRALVTSTLSLRNR